MPDPTAWLLIRLFLLVIGIAAGLYGLHRLALRLEAAGYLYYKHKKPTGGGGTAVFGELDRLVRPSIEHSIEAQDERRVVRQNDGE
ncbi:hypothetical protein [Botrimarina hoheduenensis]|uniref:Uncharacterized protein n=1 Tax=Botrimarina hoheduenensis TaxID=2528000 RepID=A0A5C5WDJ2_9BACT|nr:hypothetical protein [Botrimarina hoheduenensis]TWT47752.1 hypothetical protein Pla111_13720 [Botrimarina hoheduenensis]